MTDTMPHHICIIDSNPWVLRAMSQLIGFQTHFVVSQLSADWRTLLTDRLNPCPDIMLLDWEAPGMGPITLNRIHAAADRAKIVAMGVWLSSRRSALAAGVDGFISKTDSPEQVVKVLQRVGQFGLSI
jgi:DNA-binding NarL/FixJ family response regulator